MSNNGQNQNKLGNLIVNIGSNYRTSSEGDSDSFSLSCIGKEMTTHSSALAWRIPGTGEPGGLPSMRSHRVGHD